MKFLALCTSLLLASATAFAPTFTASHHNLQPASSSSTSSALQAHPDGGVVITGSAGGVGYAYAGEFMERGYDVVICDGTYKK